MGVFFRRRVLGGIYFGLMFVEVNFGGACFGGFFRITCFRRVFNIFLQGGLLENRILGERILQKRLSEEPSW